MPQKVYLDEQGNPTTAPVYLDEQGDPMKALSGASRITGPRPLIDRALDVLPVVGGAVGGAIGGAGGSAFGLGFGGVPGAVGGASFGGATGEALRQTARRVMGRETEPASAGEAAGDIARSGAAQGAVELGGAGIVRGLRAIAPQLYGAALRPSPRLAKEYAGLTERGLAERQIVGTKGSVEKTFGKVRASRRTASDLVRDSGAGPISGNEINQPLRELWSETKMAAAHQPTSAAAKEAKIIERRLQTPPARRMERVVTETPETINSAILDEAGRPYQSTRMVEQVSERPLPMTPTETQTFARQMNRRADTAFNAARRSGAPAGLEAEIAKRQAGGATDALTSRVPGLTAQNANTQQLAGLAQAFKDAAARHPSNLTHMGAVGIGSGVGLYTHDPQKAVEWAAGAYLVRNPKVLSMLGIGVNELARLPYAQIVRLAQVAMMLEPKASHEQGPR